MNPKNNLLAQVIYELDPNTNKFTQSRAKLPRLNFYINPTSSSLSGLFFLNTTQFSKEPTSRVQSQKCQPQTMKNVPSIRHPRQICQHRSPVIGKTHVQYATTPSRSQLLLFLANVRFSRLSILDPRISKTARYAPFWS